MADTTFIWCAVTLDGSSGSGTRCAEKRKDVRRYLNSRGYYRISIEAVSRDKLSSPLKHRDLTYILDSLVSILDAGISIRDAFELLSNERRSALIRYVFLDLKKSLHDGLSLEESFSSLSPMFPEFFIAMIRLCEKSGQLRQGLHDLKSFYQHQEQRRHELARILRYPKVVSLTMILLSLGIIIFIVPMFSNIYALFGDDLPVLTYGVVRVSRFFQHYSLQILVVCFALTGWAWLPQVRYFHPAIFLTRKARAMIRSREDPYLYAHAMSLLLDSGQSVSQAAVQATACMSEKNRQYGRMLTEKLNAGLGFAESFQQLKWFPDLFLQFMKPAEQTGLLKIGFEQIYTCIDRQRTHRFEKWSRFIEPALMLILGAVTLTLLLSIYLPIFDLGNRIG